MLNNQPHILQNRMYPYPPKRLVLGQFNCPLSIVSVISNPFEGYRCSDYRNDTNCEHCDGAQRCEENVHLRYFF